MLVNFFYKLTKNPNIKFLCGGGGGGRSEHNVRNVSNGTSTLQEIPMCQIILKYMLKYRKNRPDKLSL